MRSLSESVLCVLLCLAALPAAMAQQKRGSDKNTHHAPRISATEQQEQDEARPLTLEEGLAIISAALDVRHQARFKTDCSHFVHGLYERAGFHYEYAPSVDLYAGIDGFERVTIPQPGDLAVWRGHAGIVVNPAQHTFFSLLRSGAGVASYNSAYWRTKGRPRFFRYLRSAPEDDFSNSRWTASR